MSDHMRACTYPKQRAPFRSASEFAIGHRSSGQISESDLDPEIPIRLWEPIDATTNLASLTYWNKTSE